MPELDTADDQTLDTGADSGAGGEDASQTEQQAPVSMDDTIRATLGAIKARSDDGATGDDASDEPAVGEPPAGMIRDPATGRFVKKPEGEQKPVDPKAAKPAIDPKTGKPVAAPADPAVDPNAPANPDNLEHIGQDGKRYAVDIKQPPASWRPEAKAGYAALPEAIRREVHKRESDFHKGLNESRGWASVGQMLDKQIRPYEQMIQSRGVTADKVVGTLLQNAKVFASGTPEEKANLLLQIVHEYGITPESVKAAQERRAAGQPAVDPTVAALRQRLEGLEGKLTDSEKAQQQALFQKDMDEANRFLADPANEYGREVLEDMGKLLQTGGAETIKEAYDKAIWLNPTVRAKVLAKQQAAETKRKADEAANARRAASANVTRRGTPPEVAPKGTMDDTIRQTLRRLNGSG